MGRWLALRFLVWGLQRKLNLVEAADVIERTFPHRDAQWRADLLFEAQARADIKGLDA